MERPPRAEPRHPKNNPWEILVVGALFFFPGLLLMFQHGSAIAVQQSFRYAPSGVTAISEHGAHLLGGLAMLVGLACTCLYLYLRREIARDEVADDPPGT
jgi:hypothetical protein